MKDFKIGIISINLYTTVLNLACPLHGYAFQQFLLENGYDSEIIDYRPHFYPEDYDGRHPLYYYKKHPESDADKQKKIIKKWKNLFDAREIRYDKIWNFINTHLKISEDRYWAEKLNKKDPGYDCYICATDVLWKYEKCGFDDGFFLSGKYLKKKKKIAYAASRGASKYTKSQERKVKKYLKGFDSISVREKSFQNYLSKLLRKDIPIVLDPVFLHNKDFYLELANKPDEKGYVLICLVMDKNKKLVETAVKFAEDKSLNVIELSPDIENTNIPKGTTHPVLYDTGVEDWLGYIANAEYIFTNSFHTTCLSIIFEKQFWAGKRGGDKIDSILELLDLQDRRVNIPSASEDTLIRTIDYKKVDPLKTELVKQSKQYILDALKNAEDEISH